ncbi:MAG: transposase, partial [Acidobacteriaceae bacterium]
GSITAHCSSVSSQRPVTELRGHPRADPGSHENSPQLFMRLVLGIAERGGRVHLRKIRNLKKESIAPILDAVLSPNVRSVHTDGAPRYKGIIPRRKHIRGNHIGELKTGPVSNQTIEGVFSLFKRGVIGSYHKLGEEHMDAYLGEFCWRYNRRRQQPKMFDMALGNMTREPLPYAKLKGGDDPF